MEIRHLQYFLAVANEGTFLAAANKLHLTQPTLSRQIKELEDELGKTLFIRGSRHASLTADGILLKIRAEEIIGLIQKTTLEITSDDDNLSGEIFIGAGETAGFEIVAKAIQRLREQYPKIKINIYSGDFDDLLDYLEKGLIDFALLIGNIHLDKYEHLTLPYLDKAGLLMRKDDPLSAHPCILPKEIAHLPLFISRQPTSEQMIKNWAKINNQKLNIVGTYNLIYNASLLVKKRVGYAFALEHLVDISPTSALCFRPFDPPLLAQLHLIWKKDTPISKASQVFLDILKKEIKAPR